MRLIRVVCLAVLVAIFVPARSFASDPQLIQGAGATFPAPLYAAWAAEYEKRKGVRVAYDPVGSGAGIQRMRLRQVQFGATDAPLTQQELDAAGLMEFPVVIGGVVPVINISGIKPGQLRMTGAVLADIYLGRIQRWDAAPLAALNPGMALPNARITVVHRSDPSGSTLLWTDYLSRSSPAWRVQAGASIAPHWPTGVGGAGNEGVATFVQRTRFALGYVEYYFSIQHRLSDVVLENRSGAFVHASREAFRFASEASDWSSQANAQQLPIDAPGAQSWPITGASFILTERSPQDGAGTRAVLAFFDWALHQGDSTIRSLDYVPVPERVVEQLPGFWRALRDRAGKPVWAEANPAGPQGNPAWP